MRRVFVTLTLLPMVVAPGAALAQFETHTVADGLRFGYQVLITDLNNDGRPDLIGLGAQMSELVWFENPSWERHVIAGDLQGMINVDAADIDSDGIPELGLAYGFSTVPARSPGNIAILEHNGDPTEPWTLTGIDQLPSSHRVRWADIDGNGSPVLINAPLVHEDAQGQGDPDQLPTPLVLYRPGAWERELITDENAGTVHGLMPWDADADGQDDVVTAGRAGIHSHRLLPDGGWQRTELSAGVAAPYPDGGSSDLGSGMLGNDPFFAAIEPFHGNEVVVYRQDSDDGWQRMVIDTELANGHTLVIADLSGDGNGEIVAAGTRGPQNLYLYRAVDADGARWERSIIDDTISANSCDAADINLDGRIDVVCINMRQPNELKWYENTGDW